MGDAETERARLEYERIKPKIKKAVAATRGRKRQKLVALAWNVNAARANAVLAYARKDYRSLVGKSTVVTSSSVVESYMWGLFGMDTPLFICIGNISSK